MILCANPRDEAAKPMKEWDWVFTPIKDETTADRALVAVSRGWYALALVFIAISAEALSRGEAWLNPDVVLFLLGGYFLPRAKSRTFAAALLVNALAIVVGSTQVLLGIVEGPGGNVLLALVVLALGVLSVRATWAFHSGRKSNARWKNVIIVFVTVTVFSVLVLLAVSFGMFLLDTHLGIEIQEREGGPLFVISLQLASAIGFSVLAKRYPLTGVADELRPAKGDTPVEPGAVRMRKVVTIALLLAVLVTLGVWWWNAGKATRQKNAEGAARVREAILTRQILTVEPNLTRQLFTDAVPESDDTVLCVVMDWNAGLGTVVTLVSWVDGSTSLYISPGTAFLGVNSHESVARAATTFRDLAAPLRERMKPVDSFPLPTHSGMAVFYLVTKSKTFASEEVKSGWSGLPPDHPFASLDESAQALITEIRRAEG